MTHPGRNMSGNGKTSMDVRQASSLLILLVVLACAHPTAAAEPGLALPSTVAANPSRDDLRLSILVKRALNKDEQLQALNLEVRIKRGIAYLAGPIPSQELKQRAIKIAGSIIGVLDVRAGELYLDRSAQTPRPQPLPIQDEQPTQTRAASPRLPPREAHPSPPLESPQPQPITPPAPGPRSAAPAADGTGRQPVTLMEPQATVAPARPVQPARLTANPRPVPPSVSPVAALERLHHSDVRFQQIRTQLQGSNVFLYPGEAASEDVMRFAQAARRLAGVQHVIIAAGSR